MIFPNSILGKLQLTVLPVIPPKGGGGGGGGGHKGGGGAPGGSPVPTVPFFENGGFPATAYLLLVPVAPVNGGTSYIATFSPIGYDDSLDDSTYSYRQEDMLPNRYPSIRRVIITYRNIGQATLTITVSGVDDNNKLVSQSQTKTIGNTNADGLILTAFFDIAISCFRPQITLHRNAAGGPVSIIRTSLIGEIEEVSL